MKYRESGKKDMSNSIYSTMSDTPETNFAKEMKDMLSQVKCSLHMCLQFFIDCRLSS